MSSKIVALDALPTRGACGLLGYIVEDAHEYTVVREDRREQIERSVFLSLDRDERIVVLSEPIAPDPRCGLLLYATEAFIVGPAERYKLPTAGFTFDERWNLYLCPTTRARASAQFAEWARRCFTQCHETLAARGKTPEQAERIKSLAERARFATAVASDRALRIENYAWLLLARHLLGVDDQPVRRTIASERDFSPADHDAIESKLRTLRLTAPGRVRSSERQLPVRGDIVLARARRYLVDDVTTAAHSSDELTKLTLSCLDDDARGAQLEVLYEREPDLKILDQQRWSRVAEKGFDSPARFAAYLDAQRWNSVTSTDATRLQSPFRAAIRVEAYQLEPLTKALALPRVNLFIADDVGLGKTIEAGLVLRELLLRQKARRVVVACPPSVSLQWKDELDRRFGLSFEVFDREFVRNARRQRGQGVNPWTTHRHFIISHALLRVEEYAAPMRDWLDDSNAGPALLILDEAHHVAPAGTGRYGVDSKLTRAMRELSPRFHHRLFLSATPHNGLTNSFTALLEILDPLRFTRGDKSPTAEQLRPVMVRRLKSDFSAGTFPRREVEQLTITDLPDDAPELTLPKLLAEYRELRRKLSRDEPQAQQRIAELVTTALSKRLHSSIEAFASTLEVHRLAVDEWLDGKSSRVSRRYEELADELDAPDGDDERSEWTKPEVEEGLRDAMTKVSHVTAAPKAAEDVAQVRALLSQMQKIAERHRARTDPKLARLIEWIRAHLMESDGKRWKNRRVVVFTEYTATLDYIQRALEVLDPKGDRVAIFDGGMIEADREALKARFNENPEVEPLRILLATDAAREGVNLQNHCYDLFHFDVPWNPSRMEQRNGRIDRKLQRSPVVYCRYFVFKQRPDDKVLETLVKRTDTIRRELGAIPPVLDKQIRDLLRSSFGADKSLADAIATAVANEQRSEKRRELDAVREGSAQLDETLNKLRDRLEHSRKSMGLDPDSIRFALDESLAILKQPPLAAKPSKSDGASVERYEFPPLDQGDPSWSAAMKTLRPEQKPAESDAQWKKHPLRLVTFEDVGTIDRATVHLHLEHRVVRRLLDRFTAQGFTYNDLSRATVMATNAATPKVLMFARLVLYGQHGERLHDEIHSVSSRWYSPDTFGVVGAGDGYGDGGGGTGDGDGFGDGRPTRKKPSEQRLVAYKETQHRETLAELAAAMQRRDRKALNGQVGASLLRAVPQDIDALFGILMARVAGFQEAAEAKLVQRGAQEAKKLRGMLDDQEHFIRKQIERAKEEERGENPEQLAFAALSADEVQQRREDMRHWHRRLGQIERERAEEPPKLVSAYEVRARHVEPVGIVYLWPTSG